MASGGGASAAGSSSRGGGGADAAAGAGGLSVIMDVFGQVSSAKRLLAELGIGPGAAAVAAGKGKQQAAKAAAAAAGPDYWRLLTLLQAADLALWAQVYGVPPDQLEAALPSVRRFLEAVREVGRAMKGGMVSIINRVKAFASDIENQYMLACNLGL